MASVVPYALSILCEVWLTLCWNERLTELSPQWSVKCSREGTILLSRALTVGPNWKFRALLGPLGHTVSRSYWKPAFKMRKLIKLIEQTCFVLSHKAKKSPVMTWSQACIFQGGGQRERGGGDDGPAWTLGEKSPGCEDSECFQQYRVGCWLLDCLKLTAG